MNTVHRYIALFLCVVFVLFAVVQYNDPDPIQWMSIYFFAAAMSLGVFLQRSNSMLLVFAAMAYLVLAFFFLPDAWHGLALNPAYKQDVEHARESLGLIFTALVMLYYFFISRK